MNDLLAFFTMFLSQSWEFFKIKVPGTDFSIGVVLIGIVLIDVGFKFLSMMLGHSFGEAQPGAQLSVMAYRKSKKPKIGFDR